MVFSGRVECVASESGVMGSARFVFGVRFAENMIFAYRTLSGQRPYIYRTEKGLLLVHFGGLDA